MNISLKCKKKSFLILLLSFLFPFALAAQQTISEKVIDTDLVPLNGVTVNLKATGHSTKTNKEGIYSFTQSNTTLYVIDGFPIENSDDNVIKPNYMIETFYFQEPGVGSDSFRSAPDAAKRYWLSDFYYLHVRMIINLNSI